MVTGMMLGLIIVTHPLIVVSVPKDKESESSNKAPEGCYYKGQYHHGNWEDGCQFLCTCLNPHTGYYKCRRRCPRFKFLPKNCVLIMPRGGKCCKQPACFRIRQQENQPTEHLQVDKVSMNSNTFSNTQFGFIMKSQGQSRDHLENPKYITNHLTDKTNSSDGFRYSPSNSDTASPYTSWQTSDTDNDTQLSNRTDSSVDKKPQSDQNIPDHSLFDKKSNQFELAFRTGTAHLTKFGYHNKTNTEGNVTTSDEHMVHMAKTKETADIKGNNSDTDTIQQDKTDYNVVGDSHSNDTEPILSQEFFTTIETTQSYIDQEMSTSNNVESNSSASDPENITSNSDGNEQSSVKKSTNATNLESTGNTGQSTKDDHDTSETDKTITIRRQRLINFILRKERDFRKIQTLQRYFNPSVRNLNRSMDKRNKYDMPPQSDKHDGRTLIGRRSKFQTAMRSRLPVEKSIKTQLKIPGTAPIPRKTAPLERGKAKEKLTTINTRRKFYPSSTVTYKPIIPIYTQPPNVSLRYKEKEWGVFVTELHQMFLEVNRLKKLYSQTTPSQLSRVQDQQKTSKSDRPIQKLNIIPLRPITTTEMPQIMYKKPTRNTEKTNLNKKRRMPAATIEHTKVIHQISATTTNNARNKPSTLKPNIIHYIPTTKSPVPNTNLVKPRGHFYGQKRLTPQPFRGLRRIFPAKSKELFLTAHRTSRKADCFYQGKRYRPGEIWTNRCNKTCICSRYFDGRYWCQQERCLTSIAVPRGCRLKTQRAGCCRVLDCTELTNSSSTTKAVGMVDKLPTNRVPERSAGYEYVRTPTGIIRLKDRHKTTPKWFGTRLQANRTNTEEFCRYKGRKYVTGETWTDGCNSCQCVNGMFSRYTCHVRCPSFNKIPSRCYLHVTPRHRCCPVLRCYPDVWKAKGTSSIKSYHEDRIPTTTQRNIAIYPFVQTFFVPRIQTTETPFARKRTIKSLSRIKNSEIMLSSTGLVDSYKSKMDASKTKAAFNKRWRSKTHEPFTRNRPLGIVK